MRPKAALVKDGFTEPTGKKWVTGDEDKRGRLSLAAHKRLDELKAQGWTIDNGVPAKEVSAKPVAKKSRSVKQEFTDVADVPEPVREKGSFIAVSQTGKSPMSGNLAVCEGCKSSLTYCRCSEPRAFTDWETIEVIYFQPVKD